MYDITALGELLIDFTESGFSPNGMKLFERNPGGAVANVLAVTAKCGRKTAFIGKVGADMHGLFLKDTLEAASIDTAGLVVAEDVFTTLAFVALSPSGERAFSFARKPGADTRLRSDEVDAALLANSRLLHVGSLSLTDEPARGATFFAVKKPRPRERSSPTTQITAPPSGRMRKRPRRGCAPCCPWRMWSSFRM